MLLDSAGQDGSPEPAAVPAPASPEPALEVEDEDDDKDFEGEMGDSSESSGVSVAAEDEATEEDSQDPFGVFNAAEAEQQVAVAAAAAVEDEAKSEEALVPSSSSSGAALERKAPVFIDVEDDTLLCPKCDLPQVMCRCLQIEALKKQITAMKIRSRARTEFHDRARFLINSLSLF